MKLNPNGPRRLIEQAVKYPLNLRIAAKLVLAGWTEEMFADFWRSEKRLPEPMVLDILNRIRDIELKFTPLSDDLRREAEKL